MMGAAFIILVDNLILANYHNLHLLECWLFFHWLRIESYLFLTNVSLDTNVFCMQLMNICSILDKQCPCKFDILCDTVMWQNVFVYNCKIYLSQIAKYICFKLQNSFFSNCKMYLSQIAKCICFKLINVFVSNC